MIIKINMSTSEKEEQKVKNGFKYIDLGDKIDNVYPLITEDIVKEIRNKRTSCISSEAIEQLGIKTCIKEIKRLTGVSVSLEKSELDSDYYLIIPTA